MTINPKRNFHVPLSNDLYKRLKNEAEKTQRPATELARHAIEVWLQQRQRLLLHQSIAAYARECAATYGDLDPDFEEASVEFLLESERD